MRIMLDTNILISIAIFDSDKLMDLLLTICDKHTLVLSSYILEELIDVVKRKFPNKIKSISKFILSLQYELVNISMSTLDRLELNIRDKKDIPILYSAIKSNVDILITGDKDFQNVKIKKTKIMTPNEFYEKYFK